jgi:hypothetical protein
MTELAELARNLDQLPPALKSVNKIRTRKINNIAVTKTKIDSLQTQPK